MQTACPRLPSRTLAEPGFRPPHPRPRCPDRNPRLLTLALRQLGRGEPASRCSALSSPGLWPPEPVTPPVVTTNGVPTSLVWGAGRGVSNLLPLGNRGATTPRRSSLPRARERNVGVEPQRQRDQLVASGSLRLAGPEPAVVPGGSGGHGGGQESGRPGVPPRSLEICSSVCFATGRNPRNLGVLLFGNARACLCSLGCFASWFGLSWLVCTPRATAECEAGWVSGMQSPLVFPSSRLEVSGSPREPGAHTREGQPPGLMRLCWTPVT